MEGTQNVIGGGYEELNRRTEAIRRDKEAFDRDIYRQQAEMEFLRQRWPTYQDSDKTCALQDYADIFPRTRRDSHPQDCLRRIIGLPSPEDVLRELRVREDDYENFRSDPGEDIYPTTGWFGQYLEYAKWNKVPLALHFWAALSIFGVAVRRNYFVDSGLYETWMNQFIILTGDKANGKSTARETAMGLLRRMNTKIKQLEKDDKITSARAFTVPIFGGDTTTQALIKKLADDSRPNCRHFGGKKPGDPTRMVDGEGICIIDADEFSNLFGKGAYMVQVRIPFFTEAAFKDYYSKSTKADGEENIERMAISILACTQPNWMKNTIVSDALAGGFVERANFIHRDKSCRDGQWSDEELPILRPMMAEELADRLVELATMETVPQMLSSTPEAEVYYNKWYHHQHSLGPRDKVDLSKHSLDRRCIHLRRIAGLLCISEKESLPHIQKHHLQQAIAIVEAEDAWYPKFIAGATEHDDAGMIRRVAAWIETRGTVNKQQYANHRAFKELGADKRNEIMVELIDRGIAKEHREVGGIKFVFVGKEKEEND